MLWISNGQNFTSLFENYTIQGHTLRIDVGQNWVRKYSLKQNLQSYYVHLLSSVEESTTHSNDSISVLSSKGSRDKLDEQSARETELSQTHAPLALLSHQRAESASRSSSALALTTLHFLVWAHSEKWWWRSSGAAITLEGNAGRLKVFCS